MQQYQSLKTEVRFCTAKLQSKFVREEVIASAVHDPSDAGYQPPPSLVAAGKHLKPDVLHSALGLTTADPFNFSAPEASQAYQHRPSLS